jgi:ketosteroid isomerase-like protein
MSRENVELARLVYEYFNSREFSHVPEFVAPDVEIDLSRNVFNPVKFNGYEGVEQAVSMIDDVWDDFRFVPEQLIDAGNQVVVVVKLSGKGKGSGAPVDQRDTHVITLRDGKCVRLQVYPDHAEALKAVGLSE